MAPLVVGQGGAVFLGSVEPGHTKVTHMLYELGGRPYFADGERLKDSVMALFLDIPDDVDPDAERASVLATYRASDGAWRSYVAFGDEMKEWAFTAMNVRDLARKVSPL